MRYVFPSGGYHRRAFTVEQAHIARQAFHDFGKGRHPAGLNFGDCFAYALAKIMGEPLLFKGKDFKKTDIVAAV
jgi:ribonuclease VapC